MIAAKWLLACALAGLALISGVNFGAGAEAAEQNSTVDSGEAEEQAVAIPILAYYYIWYNPSSWNRAKTDYPLLGRYSSDETGAMRKHISMAKSAGIEGFLVSWKDTHVLTPRLDRIVGIAREMDFSLGIVYQGLDFEREPISVEKIRHDLELFADRYADDPVFDILGPPVVVWTGTKRFSRSQIEYALEPVEGRLSVLASAGDVAEYERVADIVQGNAHYWSSVNPERSWYPIRMNEMSAAVHEHDGLWIAPAAPGFDARLVGGKSVVPRDGTTTLAKQLSVAVGSGADAVGLISWNEFSENSHVEPSEQYGKAALQEVARFVDQDPETVIGIDSSGVSNNYAGFTGWVSILVTTLLLVGGVFIIRRGHSRRDADESLGGGHVS